MIAAALGALIPLIVGLVLSLGGVGPQLIIMRGPSFDSEYVLVVNLTIEPKTYVLPAIRNVLDRFPLIGSWMLPSIFHPLGKIGDKKVLFPFKLISFSENECFSIIGIVILHPTASEIAVRTTGAVFTNFGPDYGADGIHRIVFHSFPPAIAHRVGLVPRMSEIKMGFNLGDYTEAATIILNGIFDVATFPINGKRDGKIQSWIFAEKISAPECRLPINGDRLPLGLGSLRGCGVGEFGVGFNQGSSVNGGGPHFVQLALDRPILENSHPDSYESEDSDQGSGTGGSFSSLILGGFSFFAGAALYKLAFNTKGPSF